MFASRFFQTWGSVGAVLAVYGLGVVSGWFGERQVSIAFSRINNEARALSAPGQFEKLLEPLDLNPDQRKKIDAILADSGDKANVIRERVSPDIKELRRHTLFAIQAELNPSQKRLLRQEIVNWFRNNPGKYQAIVNPSSNPPSGQPAPSPTPSSENF